MIGDLDRVRTTAELVLGAGLCGIPLGMVLGFAIASTSLAMRRIALALLVGWLFVPTIVHATAWESVLGQLGVGTGGNRPRFMWQEGFWGAVWIHGMIAVPWIAFVTQWRIRGLDPDVVSAIHLETSARGLLRILLPPLAADIGLFSLAWIAAQVMSDISISDLFQVRTLAESVYLGYILSDDPWRGSEILVTAVPLSLLLVTLLTAGLLTWSSARLFAVESIPASASESPSAPSADPSYRWVRRGCLFVALGLVLVPALGLVRQAGMTTEIVDGRRSPVWSAPVLAARLIEVPSGFGSEFLWTLGLAGLCASVSFPLAVTLAGIAWRSRRLRWGLIFLLVVFLAIPGPSVALLLDRGFSRPHATLAFLRDQTLWVPCLSLIPKILPWQVGLVAIGLRNLPREWFEDAATAGSSWWQTLWHVGLPPLAGWLWSAWLVGGLIVFGDVSSSILVLPPGVTTIAPRIFGLLHAGVTAEVACFALFLALFLMAVTLGLPRRTIRERDSSHGTRPTMLE